MGTHEEEVCQIDFGGGTCLGYNQRSILTAQVQISQAKSKNDSPCVGWQPCDIFLKDLVPAELSIEPDLRKGW